MKWQEKRALSMSLSQARFLRNTADQKRTRISVRSICLRGTDVLVQRPADDPNACYAFIGGALEFGELMEERLRQEYQEETGRSVVEAAYLFVVENRFRFNGVLVHSVEHFFRVSLDSYKVQSGERHLTQHWLPVGDLTRYDFRPRVVRDAIVSGAWQNVKHLIVPFE